MKLYLAWNICRVHTSLSIHFMRRNKYIQKFQVAVPSLQSPMNAVAPSDIVFNRPPAANSISTAEYFTGIQSLHVKTNSSIHNDCYNNKSEKKLLETAIGEEKQREIAIPCVGERNNKEVKIIEEISTSMGPSTSKILPPLTTCLVDSMVRSCSVGMYPL